MDLPKLAKGTPHWVRMRAVAVAHRQEAERLVSGSRTMRCAEWDSLGVQCERDAYPEDHEHGAPVQMEAGQALDSWVVADALAVERQP